MGLRQMPLPGRSSETAFGQHLDTAETFTEDEYWAAVKWKSTPFYRHAFSLGALLALRHGSTVDARLIRSLGTIFGEIVQVIDDMVDVMATPASRDLEPQQQSAYPVCRNYG